MSDTLPPPGRLGRQLWRLAPYLRPERTALLGIVLLSTTGAGLAACEPWILKCLFDGFVMDSEWSALLWPFASLVVLLVAKESLSAVFERIFWRTRLAINFTLLHVTVERLHSLPLQYHRESSVGGTMTKIERGVSGAMSAFSELFVQLLPAVIYLCVSIAVMLSIDMRLSLVVLLFAPLPALIGARAAKEQTQREYALLQRWTRIFARFNEVLSGIVVVKSFVMEEQEKRRFLGGVQEANGLVLRGVGTDANVNAAKNAVMALARISALALGGTLVMHDEITLGTLVAFVSYLGGLFAPISSLTGLYQTLRRASVSLSSIVSILDAQDSLGDAPDAREPGQLRGEVEFRSVTFGYRPGTPVLRDINLCVTPGETVALVGASGAGKTTMMALLQRLYDPDQGGILLDGQDLRSLKQRAVRHQMGVVLQEGILFSDSIRDNIAFGCPNATQPEVEAAARAAHAHDFIMALPDGYDTQVGERATKLSGGERQRIAIARALLKNAPILILDEATSALDADSEEKVQAALAELTHNRTSFVIAHRLSTVVSADRILVFEAGQICESGTHTQLMEKNGHYAALVRKQMRGFLGMVDSGRPTWPQSRPAAIVSNSANMA
jgi:ATP-binding cassette subfamily B protein